MTIKSKQLFIIIGDDKTGKTTLQKYLIEKICNYDYDRLPTNLEFDITHPEIKRKYKKISFGNRSFQEKIGDYISVENYFEKFFKSSDIAFISSHLMIKDIEEMINQGKMRFYNVTGIFWTNSIKYNKKRNGEISLLNWDERLVIENPIATSDNQIEKQLNDITENIVTFLANRTSIS